MDTILQAVLDYHSIIIYSVIFMLIFFENILPMVPGDAVLIFSVYLCGKGITDIYLTFLLSVVGSLTGFSFAFYISRKWGPDIFQKLHFLSISPEKIKKYELQFKRFGSWSLITCRMIPGIRLIMAVIAGFLQTSYIRAFLTTLLGIIIWNSIIFRSGLLLGEHWGKIRTFITQYSLIVNIILGIFLTSFIVIKYLVPKLSKAADHE